MTIKTLKDLFIHLLSDVYNAEKQITRALPKMARAADEQKLVDAFKEHLEQTYAQIERIDNIVDATEGVKVKRIKCVGMEGVIEEGQEIIDGAEKGPVCDIGLIGAAQKVEHYEIAAYSSLVLLAKQLGYSEAERLLNETLKEEKDTDSKLSKLSIKMAEQKPQAQAAASKVSPTKSASKSGTTKTTTKKVASTSKKSGTKATANKLNEETKSTRAKTAASKPATKSGGKSTAK